MKIVLDTNIIISAFFSHGLSSEILKLGKQKSLEIFSFEEILEEAKTRLISKLHLEESYVEDFINHARKSLKVVIPVQKINVVKFDSDDNKILECAVEAGANLIVTMDKHLLKLKTYEKIGIIHPKTLTWIIPKLLS